MSVVSLKVFKNYVYGEVILGYDDHGRVTTNVRMPMHREDVQEALAPLLELLGEVAHENVRSADFEAQVDKKVLASVAEATELETARLRRNDQHARTALAERIRNQARWTPGLTPQDVAELIEKGA